MQIQYCDECGARIDNVLSVGAGEKLYCPECAPNHIADAPSKVRAASVRARPVLPRPKPSASSPRMSAVVKQSSARTPAVPVAAPPPVVEEEPEVENEEIQEQPEETDFLEERDEHEEHEGPGEAYKEPVLPAKKIKTLILAIAGVVVAALSVGVYFILGGKKADKPKEIKQAKSDNTSESRVPTNTVEKTSEVVKAPDLSKSETPAAGFDPRADMASREWEALKKLNEGKSGVRLDLKRRLEKLLEPLWIRKEKYYDEAAKLLTKIKDEKLAPENPGNVVPGATAELIFPKDPAAEFNKPFQPAETKTVPVIEFLNMAELIKVFGHEGRLAARFKGYIEVPKDGKYTFYLDADDGAELLIDQQLLVDNADEPHAMTERDGTVDLRAGKHAFQIAYYNTGDEGGLVLSWSGPGIIKQTVPAGVLFSTPK